MDYSPYDDRKLPRRYNSRTSQEMECIYGTLWAILPLQAMLHPFFEDAQGSGPIQRHEEGGADDIPVQDAQHSE